MATAHDRPRAGTTDDATASLGAKAPQPAAEGPTEGAVAATAVGAGSPKAPSKRRAILLGIVALAGATIGAWVLAHRGLESTDDAQVDGEVVGVAARTSGLVVAVNFVDNARVTKDAPLAELDPAPAKASLAQAEASLAAARAAASAAAIDAQLSSTNAKATNRAASASLNAASAGASASKDQITEAHTRVTATESALAQTTMDFGRTERLVTSGALPQAQLDAAKTARDTAEANVAQARAHLASLESSAAQAQSRVGEASARVDQTREVDAIVSLADAKLTMAKAKVAELEAVRDRAALELSFTKVLAPQDGVVSKKTVAVGQAIAAGAPIAQLIASKDYWVTANFKETQVANMRTGQHVTLVVDGIPGETLRGTVESFAAATGARFALLPPDNATGNFTKVVQRLPVRIRLEPIREGIQLRPGMSVDVTVDTRK